MNYSKIIPKMHRFKVKVCHKAYDSVTENMGFVTDSVTH